VGQRQSTHASKLYTHTRAAVEGLQLPSESIGGSGQLLEAPLCDVHEVMSTLEAEECEVDAQSLGRVATGTKHAAGSTHPQSIVTKHDMHDSSAVTTHNTSSNGP
jgi:hypothetical protein